MRHKRIYVIRKSSYTLEVKIKDASFYTVFPNFLLASHCTRYRYLVIFFPEFNFSSGCLEMRTIFSDPYSNV